MNETCFVIQSFDKGKFDQRYEDTIKPAIKDAGLDPYRVDEDSSVTILIERIEEKIESSRLCVADITTDNPNVWYEVGYAFAKKKEVILLCSDEREPSEYPFDIRHRNVLQYKTKSKSDYDELLNKLTKRIKALLSNNSHERIKSLLIEKADKGGFYHASIVEIVEVPQKNGRQYNCYRLDRLIDTPREPDPSESHCLLYEKETFESLSKGDKIKFKLKHIEEPRCYTKGGLTRNIYPMELIKV